MLEDARKMQPDTESLACVEKRVIEALREGALQQVADELRTVGHSNNDPLAVALALAVQRAGELRTVERLAMETGTDRHRLAERWRRLPRCQLSLAEFMRLLLLVRGCMAYREHGSWFRVSYELDVHVRTLRKVAKRVVGMNLREIHGDVPVDVAAVLAAPITDVLTRYCGKQRSSAEL